MAADLAGFIAREKPEAPAVIGHSPGRLAGMLPAARHPRAVGQQMVVDALPFTVLYATGTGPMATIWTDTSAGTPATPEPVADSYRFIMLDQSAAFADAVERFLR